MAKIIADLKEGEVSQAFATTNGAGILKVAKSRTGDDSQFESEKEEFKKKILQEKAASGMRELLGKLRNKLKIDVETMKKIFSEEPLPTA